jgi:hypothetical protein
VCSESEEEVGDGRNCRWKTATREGNRRVWRQYEAPRFDSLQEDGEDGDALLLVLSAWLGVDGGDDTVKVSSRGPWFCV